jgi:DNA-binding transcriptional MerR regulator
MFRIGQFSKLCRVPVSTLRYYSDQGLLPPAEIDAFTGYRYYSLAQLPRLNRILALKDLNLSLEQIATLLDESPEVAELRGMLRMKQMEIEQNIAEEQARLDRVAARLKQIEEEGMMPTNEVVLKQVEPQHVIAMREVIADGSGIPMLLMTIAQQMMDRKIESVNTPMTIFHDPEFKQADLDVEVAIPVAETVTEPIPLEDGRTIQVYNLPGITAACLVYEGAYDEFDSPYAAIGRWIENNGYKIAGSPRELYHRPPSEEEPALTEIQYPVERS